MRPIIQASPLHLTVVERKAQGFDEMKRRAGGQTGATGVAGVPVDLGVDEDNVHERF